VDTPFLYTKISVSGKDAMTTMINTMFFALIVNRFS